MITDKISLCLTTYNRPFLTLRAFQQVLNHPSIDDIVIVDDNSSDDNYQKLKSTLAAVKSPKIRLFRNTRNFDCYQNKKRAIELAKNDWVIIFDSDNILGPDYVNKLTAQEEWVKDCIYAPDFAMPHFDYREFSGNYIHNSSVAHLKYKANFECLINTCNYFVNREEYLKVHKSDINPHAADTAYFNYCWINSGHTLYVVKDLQYQHDVHDGSHYKEHNHKSNDLFLKIMKDFNDMRNEDEQDWVYEKQNVVITDKTPNMDGVDSGGIGDWISQDKETSIVTFIPQGRMGNFLWTASVAYVYAKKHGLDFSMPGATNDQKWNPIYFPELIDYRYKSESDIILEEKTYFKCDEIEYKSEYTTKKQIALKGYFQNPKYLEGYESEIRSMFGRALKISETKRDTISISVRRGDYLIYTDKHPAFSDEYMVNAMKHFRDLGYFKFEIFSDDIPWCRTYFANNKFNWASLNFNEGTNEIQDMKGIAECAGHINAPSTFSWWGAWLSENPDNTVTPSTWLLHAHSNEWTNEIYPSDWIKIDNKQ